MRISIILIISSLLFVRCYTPSYKNEISGIDSLASILNNTEQELNKIDTVKIQKQYKTFISNMNKLDALDKNKWDYLDKTNYEDYQSLGNMFFNKFQMQYTDFRKEINYSKGQINNLKSDLIKGMMPKTTFDSHFRIEKKAVNTLNKNIELFLGYTKNYSLKFDNLNPRIEKIKAGQ